MSINDIDNSNSNSSLDLSDLFEFEKNNDILKNKLTNKDINKDIIKDITKDIETPTYNNVESNINDEFNETNYKIENNKQIKEELLKQKAYYKILLNDYRKFLKKINFQTLRNDLDNDFTANTTTTTNTTNTNNTTNKPNKKQIDKNKNYSIEDISKNLYKNIKNIKKDLYFIFENFTAKILILDGENILKSYKYQQLIKSHLTHEEQKVYFYYWYNGSNDGLIQPLTSMNLTISDKLYLIEILIKNYLPFYNCIIFLSGKILIDSYTNSLFINDKQSILIPIIYDKDDIREQDDHLLLYTYYHFSKIFNCDIISGDKFKWFNHAENYLKNFRLEYNFDENKININVVDAYTNDLIIYNKHKYQIGYYYFPFIKNILSMCKMNCKNNYLNCTCDTVFDCVCDKINQFDDIFYEIINGIMIENSITNFEEKYQIFVSEIINKKDYDSIIYIIINIFLILIDLNANYEKNAIFIKIYSDCITFLTSKIIYSSKTNFDDLIFLLKRLGSINKKAFEKIEKYNIHAIYQILFNSKDDLSNLSSLTADLFFEKNIYKSPNLTNTNLENTTLKYTIQEYKTLENITPENITSENTINENITSQNITNPETTLDDFEQINKFKQNIENYISMTEIYLLLKSMTFLLNNNKSIIKIAKLFSCIMKIYDKVEESIHKIRKISNNSTYLNKVFLTILSHHVFMKKNGFCKKDY
jgi:hypothetical protein